MGLLDTTTPSKLASRARLVLDLDELRRAEWVSLKDYACIRKIPTRSAARRSIFRLKRTLAECGVRLKLTIKDGEISARFGTQEIADLIEPDVRIASKIVLRLDERRNGGPLEDEDWADEEGVVISPETISLEYRKRAKSFAWIARKHGIGKGRLRKILISTGPIRTPKVCRRVEQRRPATVVARAVAAAERGAPIDEIAKILECSHKTALRFLKRFGLR